MAIAMRPQVAKFKQVALDLLFPKWCLGCGREGDFICPDCALELPWTESPLCPMCGKPQADGTLCPGCRDWQADISGIRSPLQFTGIVRKAVHQLKYKNLRALSEPLSGWLSDYLTAHPLPGDVLVPVPVHPKRLKERGYNQSFLLAKELGKRTGLPVNDSCLLRRTHTPPQARTQNVNEQRSNVAGAFTCRNRSLTGKQVLLIDNVATSGATLNACATALKAAGAVSVWGLTLAREF